MEEDTSLQAVEEEARQEENNWQLEWLGVPVKELTLINLMMDVKTLNLFFSWVSSLLIPFY